MDEILQQTCDRCGPHVRAAARIVLLPSMGVLYLCGHHSHVLFGDHVDPGIEFEMHTPVYRIDDGELVKS